MRIQNEQSGSTSLFAQPLAIEAVPEEQGIGNREQGTEDVGTKEQRIKGADVNTGLAEVFKGHGFSRTDKPPENEEASATEGTKALKLARGLLESRLETTLAELSRSPGPPSATIRQGHLALLKRWYYRPEAKRAGEICFPNDDGSWPLKSILRSAGRVAARMLVPEGPA